MVGTLIGTLRALARRVAVLALACAAMSAAQAQTSCPELPPPPDGRSFENRTLDFPNFSRMDMRRANFRNAKLKGAMFIGADLTGADFSGATFIDSGSPARPNDFSFANLDSTAFVCARFQGPTYLTYANLPCADFSYTDINNGNAIFGDAKLALDSPSGCHAKFQHTTMNCEFVAQWNRLDLTGANIAACTGMLVTRPKQPGFDFSGGIYSGVTFDNLDLSGSKWTGAVLEHASFQNATLDNATGLAGAEGARSRLAHALFNNASVRNVDLSYTLLYGADFTNAELSGSRFVGAFLLADPAAPNTSAAHFDGAHLKNVTFEGAQLQAVTFTYASLYGTYGGVAPAFPCLVGCASAAGANLTSADFSNAFLYGVDFRGSATTINGTKFNSAILVGASFAGAKFQVNGGAAPQFEAALLQGTIFDADADLDGASLLDAFVDFGAPTNRSRGNLLYLRLDNQRYTSFRGWSGSATPCVLTAYAKFSAVPPNASMTCPHGDTTVCGGGTTPQSITNWMSHIAMASNDPVPGWYGADATYDRKPADRSAICGNGGVIEGKW